jgi:hypothetical protein
LEGKTGGSHTWQQPEKVCPENSEILAQTEDTPQNWWNFHSSIIFKRLYGTTSKVTGIL